MRRRGVAIWLTTVVALSVAVRPTLYDPTSRSTSGAKHDRHVGHVASAERYIFRKLSDLETRLNRRLLEQSKRLNHSITVHYLEKARRHRLY